MANTKNVKLTQIIEVYLKKRTAYAEEAVRFPARYGAMRSKSKASGIKTGRVAAVLTGKAQRGSSRIGKTEVIYLVTVK